MKRVFLLVLVVVVLVVSFLAPPAHPDEDREFRQRVDRAITKGCEYLVSVQGADGNWNSPYDSKYPRGATTLCTLALLLSEHNKWSDPVQNALKVILAKDFSATYSATLAMMVVEAAHIPPDEFKAIREGRPIRKFVRKIPEKEKKFLKRHVDMLLKGRQHEAWGYPKDPNFAGDWGGDLSNTQYALLGLKSASRCGVKVEEDVWFRLLRIILTAQEREGRKIRLIGSKTPSRGGHVSVETRVAQVRGWRYRWPYSVGGGKSTQTVNPGPDDKPSGSMTTAGISSLAIIHSELLKKRRYQNKIRDVSRAINDGFAWLSENWSVESNPGGKQEWHYYYLYGLERAGVLAGRKWIGDHDWYREGAEYLLDRQHPNGGWPGGFLDTSFALLFLKRSTTPVATTGLHR